MLGGAQGETVPLKRFLENGISFPSKFFQIIRRKVRAKILEFWSQYPNAEKFDAMMRKDLVGLKIFTKINQKVRRYLS
jgi:hypothetical protein